MKKCVILYDCVLIYYAHHYSADLLRVSERHDINRRDVMSRGLSGWIMIVNTL